MTEGAAQAAPIIFLPEADSTNLEARRLAEAGEIGPLWIATRRQTAGRGRRGRSWSSGQGNLAATLLNVTDKPPAEAAQVSFVAALAVADLAEAFAPGAEARLKWPNDLLLGGRKAAGILVESGARDDGRLWLAVGIGVNLAQSPKGLDQPTAAFSDFATPPTPQAALDLLAERFAAWERTWRDFGFAPIASAWTALAYGLGQACEAHIGAETVTGTAEALEPDGALRLSLWDGQVRRITAGDVVFGTA
ncbi:MAG TPA: biotin--[acetyl-CoA-carboxylase] ligase [Caulobacteraceae bacterium]|jgi:BirA family biotin operon repressor/biotin-[acetyl-CoA-carboxylase] ligase